MNWSFISAGREITLIRIQINKDLSHCQLLGECMPWWGVEDWICSLLEKKIWICFPHYAIFLPLLWAVLKLSQFLWSFGSFVNSLINWQDLFTCMSDFYFYFFERELSLQWVPKWNSCICIAYFIGYVLYVNVFLFLVDYSHFSCLFICPASCLPNQLSHHIGVSPEFTMIILALFSCVTCTYLSVKFRTRQIYHPHSLWIGYEEWVVGGWDRECQRFIMYANKEMSVSHILMTN